MKFEVSSNKIFSLNGSNKEEIHPFWLRERVSEKEYLDEGTQQRLFDPSTMRNSVEIIIIFFIFFPILKLFNNH